MELLILSEGNDEQSRRDQLLLQEQLSEQSRVISEVFMRWKN